MVSSYYFPALNGLRQRLEGTLDLASATLKELWTWLCRPSSAFYHLGHWGSLSPLGRPENEIGMWSWTEWCVCA